MKKTESVFGVPLSCCCCCSYSHLHKFINALILLIGTLFYSSNNVFLNWVRVVGLFQCLVPFCLVVPKMLSREQIWPVKWDNVMVSLKVTTNSGYMGPGIIILENQLTWLHKRDCNGLRTSIHAIPYTVRLNLRIWPIGKAIPIKNSNLTEFSDFFTTGFMKK